MTYREARACACHTEFAAPGTEPRYAPDLLLEPTHLSIALTVDLEQARASGHVTTTVVARARAG